MSRYYAMSYSQSLSETRAENHASVLAAPLIPLRTNYIKTLPTRYLQNGKSVEYTGLTNISIQIKEKYKEHTRNSKPLLCTQRIITNVCTHFNNNHSRREFTLDYTCNEVHGCHTLAILGKFLYFRCDSKFVAAQGNHFSTLLGGLLQCLQERK